MVMYKALTDHGAKGRICDADMLVLKGSDRFVDVSGCRYVGVEG
jgi:hypothetical protein